MYVMAVIDQSKWNFAQIRFKNCDLAVPEEFFTIYLRVKLFLFALITIDDLIKSIRYFPYYHCR